ncbi:MAG: hypothetical protein AAGB51_10430 [Planctomycetota bacterium]
MADRDLSRCVRIAAIGTSAALSLAVAPWLITRILTPDALSGASTVALLAVLMLVLLPPSVLGCWVLDKSAATREASSDDDAAEEESEATRSAPTRTPKALPRRVAPRGTRAQTQTSRSRQSIK